MDFLRSILKWIILGILFIVIIVLIVKLSSRTEEKTTQVEPPTTIVDQTQKEPVEETMDDNPQNENLTVDSPDTASTAFPHIVLGLVILTIGGRYIYKNRNVKENS